MKRHYLILTLLLIVITSIIMSSIPHDVNAGLDPPPGWEFTQAAYMTQTQGAYQTVTQLWNTQIAVDQTNTAQAPTLAYILTQNAQYTVSPGVTAVPSISVTPTPGYSMDDLGCPNPLPNSDDVDPRYLQACSRCWPTPTPPIAKPTLGARTPICVPNIHTPDPSFIPPSPDPDGPSGSFSVSATAYQCVLPSPTFDGTPINVTIAPSATIDATATTLTPTPEPICNHDYVVNTEPQKWSGNIVQGYPYPNGSSIYPLVLRLSGGQFGTLFLDQPTSMVGFEFDYASNWNEGGGNSVGRLYIKGYYQGVEVWSYDRGQLICCHWSGHHENLVTPYLTDTIVFENRGGHPNKSWYIRNFQPDGCGVPGAATATPTPAYTSTPAPNMCEVVTWRNKRPVVDIDPEIDISGTTCYRLIPGFHINFNDDLTLFGWTLPTLHVDRYDLCINWYNIPPLTILGVYIDLQLILIVPLAFIVVRLLQF